MRLLLLVLVLGMVSVGVALGGPSPVTPYSRMAAELRNEARHSPWVRLTSLGKSAGGRTLWLVRAGDPAAPPAARTVRVLVLCRQHGDEPASTEAMLGLLRRLAGGGGDLALRAALRRVTLYVVPMVNPDGAAVGTRANGAGADLNRDWGVFSQPETRAVARAVGLLRPQIVVDAHNWDGGDHYDANCLEVARDASAPLVRATQALQDFGVAQLQASGYDVAATTYGPQADPHLAHRWLARQGIVACLVETHSGDPRDAADFQRRQGVYVALVRALAAHYAGVRPGLDALEGRGRVQESRLFLPTPPELRAGGPLSGAGGRSVLWPWAVLPYALALFAHWVSRGTTRGTGPRAAFAPATAAPSAVRPGRRRYPHSPCFRASPPTPAAYGRRR